MSVDKIMSKTLVTVVPGVSVVEAVKLFNRKKCPVCRSWMNIDGR